MVESATVHKTHAETIAPFRSKLELVANSANILYAALALGAVYATAVADVESPTKRLLLGLVLLAPVAAGWYFVCIRRSGKSCILIALFSLVVGIQLFSNGGVMDYVLAGVTISHLLLFVPVTMLDRDFERFSDEEERKRVATAAAAGEKVDC